MPGPSPVPAVLVVLGPTATGKTDVAIRIAETLDGEIISADSRAFFAGLDIVTAKPTPEERNRVPHHLIDRVPMDGSYDAMEFRRDVAKLVPDIAGRGRVPILAGGATLYLAAVLRGLFEGPGKDPSFRDSVAGVPSAELHARLAHVDPDAAVAIHAHDRLRIVRALEVHASTGRAMSALQREAEPLSFRFRRFGLQCRADEHRAAIAARARRMLDAGLLREAAGWRHGGLTPACQAYRSVGVREAIAALDGGSETALREALLRDTWALARRQMSWFRREPDVRWIDVTQRTAADVAEEIVAFWRQEEGTT
ncbi:MAG: tRNA (adenosine(37)-N6)-dimethylallyltransferase MiaA [Candidatus Bipolaricaulota bacterium]